MDPLIISGIIIGLLLIFGETGFAFFAKNYFDGYDKRVKEIINEQNHLDIQESFLKDTKVNDVFFLFKDEDGEIKLSKKSGGTYMNWKEFAKSIKSEAPNFENHDEYAIVSDFDSIKFKIGVSVAMNHIAKIVGSKWKSCRCLLRFRYRLGYEKSISEKYGIITAYSRFFITGENQALGIYIRKKGITIFFYDLLDKKIELRIEIDNKKDEKDVLSILTAILCFNGEIPASEMENMDESHLLAIENEFWKL